MAENFKWPILGNLFEEQGNNELDLKEYFHISYDRYYSSNYGKMRSPIFPLDLFVRFCVTWSIITLSAHFWRGLFGTCTHPPLLMNIQKTRIYAILSLDTERESNLAHESIDFCLAKFSNQKSPNLLKKHHVIDFFANKLLSIKIIYVMLRLFWCKVLTGSLSYLLFYKVKVKVESSKFIFLQVGLKAAIV